MPSLANGAVTLFYTVAGTGTPLVLLHGWTCDSVDHSWLIPLLQDDFRVIAYDLRGAGHSGAANEYGFDLELGDLAAVIERVAGGPALLVGHSHGAALASAMAVERPDLVLGVVALDGPFGVEESIRPFMEEIRAQLGGTNPHEVAKSFFARHCFTDETPDWLRTLVLRRVDGDAAELVRGQFAELWTHPDMAYQPASDRYLARRTCPVLVVHRDAALAAHEENIFAHPASRSVVLPGNPGHWLQAERPDEVSAAIHDWWKSTRIG
jgi:pimeloyl-ACP methyl ester carboxylesterase